MDQITYFMKTMAILFFLGCFCGLIWQVSLISKLYFQYKVTTRISISIPEVIEPVATSFCTRFTDVIDFEQLNAETGRDWKYSTTGPDIKRYQNEITVKQIFDFTPHEKEIIKMVVFRRNDSYERLEKSGSQVYDAFGVTKYVYLEHVCYRIQMKHDVSMHYSFYAVTPTSPGMIYEIYLNDSLAKADLVKISMHSPDTFPYRSLKVIPVIWRQYDQATEKAHYNTFKSFQTRLVSYLLPHPYQTKCFDYRPYFNSEVQCVQSCVMQRSVKQLRQVPFSVIIKKPMNETMVSLIDVEKPDFVHKLLNIESGCLQNDCFRNHCRILTAMTTTSAVVASEFGLKTYVPSQPWITVTTHPIMDVVEFLTYVMSTISIWTGMSAMSFNPAKLIKFRKANLNGKVGRRPDRKTMIRSRKPVAPVARKTR